MVTTCPISLYTISHVVSSNVPVNLAMPLQLSSSPFWPYSRVIQDAWVSADKEFPIFDTTLTTQYPRTHQLLGLVVS